MIRTLIPARAVLGGRTSIAVGRDGVTQILPSQDGQVAGYAVMIGRNRRFVPAANVIEVYHEEDQSEPARARK